jgi:hypothetical protein
MLYGAQREDGSGRQWRNRLSANDGASLFRHNTQRYLFVLCAANEESPTGAGQASR